MGILSKAWKSVKKAVKKTHEFGVKIAKADFKLHKKIFKETVSKPFKKIWENKLLRYVAIAAAIVVGGYFLAPVIFGGGGAAAASGAGATAAGSAGAAGAAGATGAAAGTGAATATTAATATSGFNAVAAETAINSALSAEIGAAATVPTLGSVGSTVGAGGVVGSTVGAGVGAGTTAAGGLTLGDAATGALISVGGSMAKGYADGKAAEEAAKEEERRYNAQSAYGLRRDQKYENAYSPTMADVSPAAYQPGGGYMSQSAQAAQEQEVPYYMRGNA